MEEELKLDLNLPNAPQSAESLEYLEERERVIALLHDFYQERQKNMPIHKEISELAEKLRGLFERYLLEYEKFFNQKQLSEKQLSESEYKIVEKNTWTNQPNNLPHRIEIIAQDKKDNFFKNGRNAIINLLKILDTEKFNGILVTKEDRIKIEELKESFENIDVQLNQKVGELWEIRKNIAKELIKTVPEFTEFNDAELTIHQELSGLYNLDSEIWATKTFETEEGEKKKTIYFDLKMFGLKQPFENLMKQYNLTDKELKEIKELEWSAEEKEKLKNLMEDVDEYKAETEKMKQGLLKSKNLKFKDGGADIVKDEFVRAFVRQSYEDYKLPVVQKERVVQEIMNGTFDF